MAVGIDDLNLYTSSLSVDAQEIARARGVSALNIERLQLLRRSLPPAFEDPVTLAVNAALPLVTDPSRIELLIVATESGLDYGKPLSSYVHRWLGLPQRCRNLEVKHACFAGTAALQLAASWARGSQGKQALVVMTDMARKLFGNPAEPAEGAGAVALVVGQDPRVLALGEVSGIAAREIYDVTRPNPSLERANARLSLGAYLDLLEAAWSDYRRAAGATLADFSALVFHAPFGALVERGHRVLLETEDASDEVIAKSFEERVRPSLRYSLETGNLYGASLYGALASLIDSGARAGRIGLYSYGSGSCAEFFAGELQPGAREVLARHRIPEQLAARRPATVAEYEAEVVAAEQSLTAADYEPEPSRPAGLYDAAYRGRHLLVLEAVRDYYRSYRWT